MNLADQEIRGDVLNVQNGDLHNALPLGVIQQCKHSFVGTYNSCIKLLIM